MKHLLLALCIVFLFAVQVSARTWYIKPDGTGDVPTIQAGIDSAAVNDTILIAPGNYTEGPKETQEGPSMLVLKSGINIVGQYGPDVTVLDAAQRCRVMHGYQNTGVTLDGLTFTGGVALQGSIRDGGGLRCSDCGVTLRDCVFAADSAFDGGAISSTLGSLYLIGCSFVGNVALSSGGAVYCVYQSPEITDCSFRDNVGPLGGGVALAFSSATVSGCEFQGNLAEFIGGAVYCRYSSSAHVAGCLFSGNSSGWGGGLYGKDGSLLVVEGCSFWYNSGGAIALWGGSRAELTSCTICLHHTYGASCIDGSTLVASNTIIAFTIDGPGIGCIGAQEVTLSCCDLFGNAGGDWVECLSSQLGERGNVCENPLFCDYMAADLTLDEESPCAPEHSGSGCGLIGLFQTGCSNAGVRNDVRQQLSTWGSIKSMYK